MIAENVDAGGSGAAGAAADSGAGDTGAAGTAGAASIVGGAADAAGNAGASDSGNGNDGAGDAGDGNKDGGDGDKSGEKPAEGAKEGEGDKSKEGEKPAPRSPEAFADFTLPEGVEADAATSDEFKALAKELNLTQEEAQKLVDFNGGKLKAMIERPYQVWADTQKAWRDEVQADKEIGGAKYDNTVAMSGKVFDFKTPGNKFVTSEAEAKALVLALNNTGAGNNPAIVRFFSRVGGLLAEPSSFVSGKVVGAPKTVGERLYGNSKKD